MNKQILLLLLLLTFQFSSKASIHCPNNIVLQCYENAKSLTKTGKATVSGYDANKLRYEDINHTNSCGIGTIDRVWYIDENQDAAYQSNETSCTQFIQILAPGDYDIEVYFPEDKEYACEDDIIKESPTWVAGTCDFIGVNVKDAIFDVVSSSCYKIIRTYTVINWCTYNSGSNTNVGIWEHNQVIKIKENDPPKLDGCNAITIGLDGDCLATITLSKSAVDNGTCSSTDLIWEVEVDLRSNGTIDYTYSKTKVGEYYLAPVPNGDLVKITLPKRVAAGSHKVFWKVGDQCGNFSQCTQIIYTKDIQPPTAYTNILLTSSFEGDKGDLNVAARWFDKGSFDNCTPKDKLSFSFSEDIRDSIRVVDCTNGGFQFYNIYVTDRDGNHSYTEAYMVVFDNGTCSGGVQFGGRVTASSGAPLEDVSLTLARPDGDSFVSRSDEKGDFIYQNASLYSDQILNAQYTLRDPERIDIADLKKLQNVLFGLDSLQNFEIIAADVNKDNKLSAADLYAIKNRILDIDPSSEQVWRFFSDLEHIDKVSQLKDMKESLFMKDSDGKVDFIGVYLGDITGANGASSSPRSNITFYTKLIGNDLGVYLDFDQLIEGVSIEFEVPREVLYDLTITSPYFQILASDIHVNDEKSSVKILKLADFSSDVDLPLFKISNALSDIELKIVCTPSSRVLLPRYETRHLKIGNSEQEIDVNIYPNPSPNGFLINKIGCKVTAIYDHMGQKVRFTQEGQQVTSESKQGIYFVHLNNNGAEVLKKWVKMD